MPDSFPTSQRSYRREVLLVLVENILFRGDPSGDCVQRAQIPDRALRSPDSYTEAIYQK